MSLSEPIHAHCSPCSNWTSNDHPWLLTVCCCPVIKSATQPLTHGRSPSLPSGLAASWVPPECPLHTLSASSSLCNGSHLAVQVYPLHSCPELIEMVESQPWIDLTEGHLRVDGLWGGPGLSSGSSCSTEAWLGSCRTELCAGLSAGGTIPCRLVKADSRQHAPVSKTLPAGYGFHLVAG